MTKNSNNIDNKFRGYYKYAEDFYNNGEKREDHEHIEGKNGIYIFFLFFFLKFFKIIFSVIAN